jgi:hypothetical protein
MPTPNERDIATAKDIDEGTFGHEPNWIALRLSVYRESIIASEREAAAKGYTIRPELEKLGISDPDDPDVCLYDDKGEWVATVRDYETANLIRSLILSGQSASPKEELHSPGEVVIYASGDPCPRCGTPLGRVGLNSDNWHIVCPHCPADFGDANGPDGKAHNDGMSPEVITYYEQAEKDEYPEPVTPLQEARDRGDRLGELLYQAQSVIEFYATPPPLTASGKPQRACDMQAYEVLHRLVEARAALAAEGKL